MQDLFLETVERTDNPFVYGSIVAANDFAGRERELGELLVSIRGGKSAVIHSPRHMGKSSILIELARRYSKDYVFVYVDMRGISDEGRFIEVLTKEILRASFSEIAEFVPAIWDLIRSSRLRLAVMEGGGLGFVGSSDSKALLLASARKARPEERDVRIISRTEIRMCPKCGMPLKWIEKYARHYCYKCKKYAPTLRTMKRRAKGSHTRSEKVECPLCGNDLDLEEGVGEHYCKNCMRYPLVEQRLTRTQKPSEDEIIEALDLPEKIAAQKGKEFVVMFDEFQEMLFFDSSLLLKEMGRRFQLQKNVHYVFSGCNWSRLGELFQDKEGAFYRLAHTIPVGAIQETDLVDFLVKRFSSAGGRLDRGIALKIARITRGHPYYAQQLAHELFHISKTPSVEDFDAAVPLTLKRHALAYKLVWESIKSPLHRRYLLAIATEPHARQGVDFIRRHDLKSRSHVQRIERQLEARCVVDRREVVDPFFMLWLRSLVTH